MEDFERELKVVVLGDGGVGKSSMVRRFATGIFTASYKKTIGVDFLEKTVYLPSIGEDVRCVRACVPAGLPPGRPACERLPLRPRRRRPLGRACGLTLCALQADAVGHGWPGGV